MEIFEGLLCRPHQNTVSGLYIGIFNWYLVSGVKSNPGQATQPLLYTLTPGLRLSGHLWPSEAA